MHNELQTCGKSWNLPGYNISVILLISVFGHQGASICLKIGKNLNIVPVHNLHTQWIAILEQIMKCIGVQMYFILVILISVFGHQGASICLKIGKNLNIIIPVHNLHAQWIANLWQIMKSIGVQHFSHIDFCIWPPGGIDMSKNWKISKYRSCS